MDPITAVSFASSIVAFVDFTSKLLHTAHSLYVSTAGTTAENMELEALSVHLQLLAAGIGPPGNSSQAPSKEDAALHDLARQCKDLSSQLLALLNSFKVQGRHRKWKSVYQAMRSSRYASEIDAIQARLDRMGAQLSSHMLLQRQGKLIEKLGMMETENRQQGINRNQEMEDLRISLNESFRQLHRDKEIEDAVLNSLVRVGEHAERMSKYSHEQSVLRWLRFDGMDNRQYGISPAHAATYTWVFDPTSNFVKWLRADDNLYWVSGKPGSGKSTFMKYVFGNHGLLEHLKRWSGTQALVVAHFFFWNLGRQELHKSQEGLLRSILHQIFRQQPMLIVAAYPEHPTTQNISQLYEGDIGPHKIPIDELLAAVKAISGVLAASKTKYCFFIDGLDEYEGRPNDIINLIELLKSSLEVKICVSSRPWNEFEKVFGQDESRKLYMQDLTRDDIEAYVRDTFEKDACFQEFLEDNEGETIDLIEDIVKNANGVFLWVRLVVQNLLEGVTNADRLVDLRRRLNSMPSDLFDFFDRILFGVDNFYQRQTSHFFQVTLVAWMTMPLICYWYMDQEDDGNDKPEYALKLEVKPLTVQKTTIRLKQMRRRLNACCKGLLEVQFYDAFNRDDSSLPSSVLWNWKVDFLHRTVRDFLKTSEMQEKLQQWAAPEFNANLAICGALVAHAKTAPMEKDLFRDGGAVDQLVALFHVHKPLEHHYIETELIKTLMQHREQCGIKSLPWIFTHIV
ncbi:hypothetical protein BX600DRAFT_555055 [Xylariales sp. PMI_506]|nr:hypothetical protein BX600DRAFT_555055 [Xylariales sp. PMI_506]